MMRVLNAVTLLLLVLVVLASSDVEGYSTNHQSSPRVDHSHGQSRRSWMKTSANSIMSSLVVVTVLSTNVVNAVAAEDGSTTTAPSTNPGVISSKYCAYGQGDDCSDLAEGNPLILELQRRSSANKEKIITDAQNAYYNKNYPDFMKAVGKTMVQKPDGGFILLDDSEVSKLKQDGKIALAYPKTMNGKFTDLTQKPIPVLKE